MEAKTSKNPESVVREIKRKTRRKFNSEEKIRIILEGLKGEDSIAATLTPCFVIGNKEQSMRFPDIHLN